MQKVLGKKNTLGRQFYFLILAAYEAISAFNTSHLTPAEEGSFKSSLQSCDEQHASL